jgi:plasmid maintenance system antidote protein VapI
MSSFQIAISPKRRAAGRFIARVRRVLQAAYVEENERSGMTQSDLARAVDVHRSVISRQLNGREDMTLGRVAELAWAMGRDIVFELPVVHSVQGDNVQRLEVPATPAERSPTQTSNVVSAAHAAWTGVQPIPVRQLENAWRK